MCPTPKITKKDFPNLKFFIKPKSSTPSHSLSHFISSNLSDLVVFSSHKKITARPPLYASLLFQNVLLLKYRRLGFNVFIYIVS